ncbi:tyrosine-type recombinase/integrase [Roseimaritima sediminicola]|uniref:tyrosine-type recombinase/integrase n=1 Tax=Roseimaritima sediminicola TaxID=2662066 RepID=UPI001386E402|nr:phage integrase N-terminal SAM-like domain-containing protein [Roseimaritima sediminicola]
MRFYQDGKRRSLYLASLSKRAADNVARHVDELATAYAANIPPAPETTRWANGTEGSIRKSLERWGLIDSRPAQTADCRLCVPFFESWIVENCRTDRTENNYRQAVKWFVRRFGSDRTLTSITPAEFASWHRWMIHADRLAPSTANKHAKRIRTLFKNAIDARLLAENPGTGTKLGSEVNSDRDHYVSREDAARIIAVCDTEWALIFGLCRFAGLRCPSEVTALLWSDIDWEAGRIRIDSPKTGLRFCPLWPALRPLLDAAWDAAPEGAKYVIGRHRDKESNLRTQLTRIVQRAGLIPWPKGFVNLRASCRTDLEGRFESHVCDAWMGHSSKIAHKHYLRVTEAHWERALEFGGPVEVPSAVPQPDGGPIGGPSPARPESAGADEGTKKPSVSGGGKAGKGLVLAGEYPRRDSNP